MRAYLSASGGSSVQGPTGTRLGPAEWRQRLDPSRRSHPATWVVLGSHGESAFSDDPNDNFPPVGGSHSKPLQVVTEDWSSFVWNLEAPWLLRYCLTSPWLAAPTIRTLLWLKSPLGPLAHALTRMTIAPNHIQVLQRSVSRPSAGFCPCRLNSEPPPLMSTGHAQG